MLYLEVQSRSAYSQSINQELYGDSLEPNVYVLFRIVFEI